MNKLLIYPMVSLEGRLILSKITRCFTANLSLTKSWITQPLHWCQMLFQILRLWCSRSPLSSHFSSLKLLRCASLKFGCREWGSDRRIMSVQGTLACQHYTSWADFSWPLSFIILLPPINYVIIPKLCIFFYIVLVLKWVFSHV